MVVFRPFVGEVLKGRIVSCNEEHIRGTVALTTPVSIACSNRSTRSFYGLCPGHHHPVLRHADALVLVRDDEDPLVKTVGERVGLT
jgi:hypothetical protein